VIIITVIPEIREIILIIFLDFLENKYLNATNFVIFNAGAFSFRMPQSCRILNRLILSFLF